MKNFNGKAIYNPSGKAGEYSEWACNFFVGCSNGCTYCYCKKGILAGVMGQDTPQLKKCFRDEDHALEVFRKELLQNIEQLKAHGLFFSFTTDPLLPETANLTIQAIDLCVANGVPVKILTKIDPTQEWRKYGLMQFLFPMHVRTEHRFKIAFGFTLTGHDELEPGASTNAERIEAMRKLHDAGFKTFASIEPVIDFESSLDMIMDSVNDCDLYKIGLQSGVKYDRIELQGFIGSVCSETRGVKKLYFKDSLLKQASINRSELPDYCVGADYNLFTNE